MAKMFEIAPYNDHKATDIGKWGLGFKVRVVADNERDSPHSAGRCPLGRRIASCGMPTPRWSSAATRKER